MDCPPICVKYSLMHCFRQCRMREDGMHQFCLCCLKCLGNRIALNKLCYFRPYHMGTKQCACFGIKYCFDKAFIITKRNRLAVANKGKPAHLYVIFLGFGLCFCQPDRGNLRTAIGTSRHLFCTKAMYILKAGNRFDTDNPLMTCLMCQPGCASNIANRINASLCRAHQKNLSQYGLCQF